jgi:type IV pilus assembly protein PilC
MPSFKYKIKEKSGKVIESVGEAKDKYTLVEDLKKQGKDVVSVEDSGGMFSLNIEVLNKLLARIKLQDKINFTRNLAAMIAAGLSLSRALSILERQTKNIKFKEIIKDLSGEINKGNSLSDGLGKHVKIFSPLFVSMVRAGEESGNLADSLNVIGEQLEKSYTLRKKIKGAMMYPSIVLSAMVIIGILMLIYVVPTLTETFKDLGGELPASTQFVIFISDALSEHLFLMMLGLGIVIVGFFYARKLEKGKRVIDFSILHMPVISKIAKESNAARTTRTLSSLLSSGIDLIEALTITHDVMQNSYYKEVLLKAVEDVQKGLPLSGIFKNAGNVYPILVGEMVEVGEETGKLSEMLLQVATFYESEVDAATKDLSTIIEPILMVVIGAGVGFFAVSMISPMYEVMNNI